jgi:hypothetical protein
MGGILNNPKLDNQKLPHPTLSLCVPPPVSCRRPHLTHSRIRIVVTCVLIANLIPLIFL